MISIDDIYIDYLYKFVGKRIVKSQLMVKYREKDGNLRPKNWQEIDNSISHFNSLIEFNKALFLAQKYRFLQLALKHLQVLSTKELLECQKQINLLISKNRKRYK